MCNVGFGPSLHEIKYIELKYVESNKLKTPFENNSPGKNGLKFLLNKVEWGT